MSFSILKLMCNTVLISLFLSGCGSNNEINGNDATGDDLIVDEGDIFIDEGVTDENDAIDDSTENVLLPIWGKEASQQFIAHEIDRAANFSYFTFSSYDELSSDITDGPSSIFITDIDNDGDVDLLSASDSDANIAWYENDGQANFNKNIVASNVNGVFSVYAEDIDGDGDMDILSASTDDNTVAWYENDGSESFIKKVVTAEAEDAFSVYAVDLDSDGDIDIISGAKGNGTTVGGEVAWFENNGQEHFTKRVVKSDIYRLAVLSVADIDDDGDIDLLYSEGIYNVFWLENDSNGSFSLSYSPGSYRLVNSLYAVDLDGDMDKDIVSGSKWDDTIFMQENNGSNSFSQTRLTSSGDFGSNQFFSIYPSDFDGDGDIDIVSAFSGIGYNDNTVVLFDNDGNGNLTAQTLPLVVGEGGNIISVADMDGDGDLDILSKSYKNNIITWYENTVALNVESIEGIALIDISLMNEVEEDREITYSISSSDKVENSDNALFKIDEGSAEMSFITLPTYEIPQDADMDNLYRVMIRASDGYATEELNLIVKILSDTDNDGIADKDDDDIDGDGIDNTSDALPYDVSETVDTDNDGIGDNSDSDIDGDGTININDAFPFDITEIADTDEDGVGDYADSSPLSASDSYAPLWQGREELEFVERSVIEEDPYTRTSVLATDLDNDGDMDLISSSTSEAEITWYENDGNAVFTNHLVATAIYSATSNNFHAEDIDADGDIDIISVSLDGTIAWHVNDGSENFTKQVVATEAYGARSVYSVDVDGDSDMDLLISATSNDDTIAWYENDGSENFTKKTVTTGAGTAVSVHAADVDGDGDMDLMSASNGDDTIAWYENNGDEVFTKHIVTSDAQNAWSVYSADIDGDGDLDLISASEGDGAVAWYQNDGSQGFVKKIVSTSGARRYSIYAKDIDNDGDIDLVSGSSNAVEWYKNDGDGNFQEQLLLSTASIVSSVFAEDIDNDGDIDLISASYKFFWYESNGTLKLDVIEGDLFVGEITATDADQQTLTYSIDSGDDAALFTIDSNDGSLSFINNKTIDSPEDVGEDNIYEVTVSVTDGYTSLSRQVAVTVLAE